jgi:hypothetical protein
MISCDVRIEVNGEVVRLEDMVEYNMDITPTVTGLSKHYGTQWGGDSITISGSGFTMADALVKFDNVECAEMEVVSDSEIVCVTAPNFNV